MRYTVTHVSKSAMAVGRGQLVRAPFISIDENGAFHFGVDTLLTFTPEIVAAKLAEGSIAKLVSPIPYDPDQAIWIDDGGNFLRGQREKPFESALLSVATESDRQPG